MKKRMMIIALLCIGVQGAWAQAVADNGKSVKRITFDRENICVVYADGTKDENVQSAVVYGSGTATGIATKPATGKGQVVKREVYDPQCRQVKTVKGQRSTADGQRTKGVYIVREGEKTRKIIKK
jgi:hypothetical protein